MAASFSSERGRRRRSARAGAVVAMAALGACGGPAPSSDATVPDDASSSETGADASWSGPFALTFTSSLEATTTASFPLQHLVLNDNLGTMTVSVALPTFAPQTVDWTATTGYTLVHAYATEANNVHVSFVYCQNDRVATVWHESLDDTLGYATVATGQPCSVDTRRPQTIQVANEPFVGLPPGFAPVTGPTIVGDTVHLNADGTGTIVLGATTWTMYPFGLVNCPAAQCGAPGWYEVHSLLRADGGATAFVILYLMLDDTTHVRTGYGVRFDVPGALPNTMYTATWQY
jgi:hypothetical protein